jgi:bilirubin oxidase
MDSPLNGINYNILQLHVVAANSNAITSVPQSLVPQVSYTEQEADLTRTIRFEADSIMVMDGPFYFNGELFDMMHINYEIPINNIEIWKLVNNTMVAHPFHIHDVQFQIIDRYTNAVSKSESGRKDVVLVPPFDSVRFITKFEDFTDSLIPYMYHCHILMHEDDGMMGQFTVVNHSNGIEKIQKTRSFSMYPNPSNGAVYLQTQQANVKPIVRNFLGQTMPLEIEHGIHTWILHTEQLPLGVYTVQVGDEALKLLKNE